MNMLKKTNFKKVCIVAIMSIIVMSVLCVTGYAATEVGITYGAQGSPISGYDGTTAYTLEFTYGHSYTGTTNFTSTGNVYAEPYTNRGGTAGGTIAVNIQELNGIVWLNHSSSTAYGETVVIKNVSYKDTYHYETAQKGVCAYRKGYKYRGRFLVGALCAPSDASKVTVSPYTCINMYID